MNFFGILLVSIVAHAANGKNVNMRIESAGSGENEYISISMNYNGGIKEALFKQSIAEDADIKVDYVIEDDAEELDSGTTSFCNPEPSSQGANVVDLAMKALGVENYGCPIEQQTTRPRSQGVKGELEVDVTNPREVIDLSVALKKDDEELAVITFTGGVERKRT